MKFIDIGANIGDPVYHGVYRGRKAHEDDFDDMMARAFDKGGMEKILITSGTLSETRKCSHLCEEDDTGKMFTTCGTHPTRSSEFVSPRSGSPEEYFQKLCVALKHEKVKAIGECGLDYDRLQFSSKQIQMKYFVKQFELAEVRNLPFFFHSRSTSGDFVQVLKAKRDMISGGVVHSYTGDAEELAALLDMGMYIGINGCSFKKEENLEVLKKLPLDRIMLETDCPYCEIRPTHAGYKHVKTKFSFKRKERWEKGSLVKGRNEPCTIIQVAEVLAAILEEDVEKIAESAFENTIKLFF